MDDDPWRSIVEAHFRVYETRAEPLPGGGAMAHMYFLMFPAAELEQRYAATRAAILAKDPDAIVFLRGDGGEDVLVVAPRAPVPPAGSRANWILFLLTILTTLSAGALYWQGYRHSDTPFTWSSLWSLEHLGMSFVTFVVPLLLILGIHESAHFIAARRHGLRATLPFFIPFPPIPMPIGTLGAFIRLKDPLPDRKALFDVGASGPLAGFAVAIPVLIVGAILTNQAAIDLPDQDRPVIEFDGDAELDLSRVGFATLTLNDTTAGARVFQVTAHPDADDWHYTATFTATLENGTTQKDVLDGDLDGNQSHLRTVTVPADTAQAKLVIDWDDGLVRFGDPLFVKGLKLVGLDNDDYLTHPTFFAGWVGLLVTGINLLPAGQLDGGHVARAVFGDRMRYVAYAAVGGLVLIALQFQTWILMAIFILLMGIYHPPPLNDRVELDVRRKVVAAIVLVVFVLTFVPRPIIL